MREDGRQDHKIRPVKITRNYLKYAEGSALVEAGGTKVICNASVEEKVPPHLRDTGSGWVTAEYAMLPRATNTRSERERFKLSGRTQEIQRVIGRSLRAVVDLKLLGERTIIIDCDVLQADGGTRTVAITGGFIALVDAIRKMKRDKKIASFPVKDYLAAISVGIVKGNTLLDLDFQEDSSAEVDMNVVMTGSGDLVEVQATGEEAAFPEKKLLEMLGLARKGIAELIAIEKEILGDLK
ncbi:ribonuclease PH [bacterium]|nr:ribonuclease PH [bacterium]